MKISTTTIRFINEHYGSAGDPAPHGVDDLVQKIGAQLGAVEEVIPFGKKFEGVLIVRVVTCDSHPNADRLHVCKVDDGGKAQDVERDEQGYVQVVCGAPNVRAGMLAAWLPPGSTVPSTYDKEPFVLESRELRGMVSNGMMASPKELGLGDSHEGILEVDEEVAPGTQFAEAYHLTNDVIIDMENKMFTHRPDCFGWLGIARELEGIQHRPYKSPAWYTLSPTFPDIETSELRLEVRNELPELVPRFTAIVLHDVHVGPSPVWLLADLAKAGVRSINNIVDYTNFFMLETGQPIHAYDYDKVKALSNADHASLVIRHPRAGEKITLLNGKTIEPRPEAMMVATDSHLLCVGGSMGGIDTEVDEHTKNVIIEAANWDMFSIRKTSMAHGIFTDAVTRFNKGQSPLQNLAVVAKIVDEIRHFAGGKVASPLIDDMHLPAEMVERGSVHSPVHVTREFINTRLGLQLNADEMATLLRNVEFDVQIESDTLTVTAPFWRTDIAIPEDIVEEIGRLYGYDHLPLVLPKRDLTPAQKDPMLTFKSQVRNTLSQAGANEVLTYSFVHGNLLDKTGQDRDLAFQLSNALSPDLQFYRLSLTPNLLELVHPNHKVGHDVFALFEIGKVHIKGSEEEGLPTEFDRVAMVFTADKKAAGQYAGAAYYQARFYMMHLFTHLGITDAVVFEPLKEDEQEASARCFEPGRGATVKINGATVGRVGEYKSSIRKALKLPDFCAGFELGLRPLQAVYASQPYVALPRFPKIEQDICLRVPTSLPYQQLYQFVEDHLYQIRPDQTVHTLSPVDIYQRDSEAVRKQITFRLSAASYERTLTDDEVNTLLDNIAAAAREQFGAERV